jgi:hypothetical protein
LWFTASVFVETEIVALEFTASALLHFAGIDGQSVGPIAKPAMSLGVDEVADPVDRSVAECHHETARMGAAEVPNVPISGRIL